LESVAIKPVVVGLSSSSAGRQKVTDRAAPAVAITAPGVALQLLHYPNYLVRPRFDPQRKVDIYDILDATTQSLIGSAGEVEPKFWLKVLRWTWGRNLFRCTVHIREHDGSSPLFSMREARGLWSPRLDVINGTGQVLCWFKPRFAILGGGFTVHGPDGELLGELECPTGEVSYRFVARSGLEVGTVVQQILPAGNHLESSCLYFVTVKEWESFQMVAGLLLLAAALSLDIVYRERV
jgi:hypothetical protein